VARDQILESSGPGHARGENVQIPQLRQEREDGGVGVLARLADGLIHDNTLADPGRDQEGGYPRTETLEVERHRLAVRGVLGVGEVVTRGDVDGGGDVVGETAVLVEGQNEEGLVPLRGGAEGLVDALDEALPHGDGRRGVVGPVVAAFRVDVGEAGELAGLGVLVELGQGLDVGRGLAGRHGPVVEHGVGQKAGRVGVVDPGDVLLGQLLEDGTLRESRDVEISVVSAVAVRRARGEVRAVRVRRARDGTEPAVEENEVLGHGVEHRDVVRGQVVDRLSRAGNVVGVVGEHLLGHEALHRGLLLARLDRGLVRVPGAEQLHVHAADAVVWIVWRDVLCDRPGTNPPLVVGVCDVDGVAVWLFTDAIDLGVVLQTSKQGIE